jgi:DNA-directed RNA polymerase specialized sigma subunit
VDDIEENKNIPTRKELDKWYDKLFKKREVENIPHNEIFDKNNIEMHKQIIVPGMGTKIPKKEKQEVAYMPITIRGMKEQGMTQKDIAKKLNISQGQVSKTLKKFANTTEN